MKIFILHTEEEHYKDTMSLSGETQWEITQAKNKKLFHNKTRLIPVTLSTGSFISFQAVVLWVVKYQLEA